MPLLRLLALLGSSEEQHVAVRPGGNVCRRQAQHHGDSKVSRSKKRYEAALMPTRKETQVRGGKSLKRRVS